MKNIKNLKDLYYEFSKWKTIVSKVNRYYDQSKLLDLLYDNRELFVYEIHKGIDHSNRKAYIEIISYKKLLENAQQRNKMLFDKLFEQ